MAKMKAKQLYFSSVSQLIVGNAQGGGSYLNAGTSGSTLRVNGSDLEWSILDIIRDVVSDTSIQVSPAGASFAFGPEETDPKLTISANGTTVEIAADGGTEDILLVPGANGNVVIAGDGEGVIEAEADEDLSLKGGAGSGNLFLSAGATGKVYYAEDATDPGLEVATVGSVGDATKRLEYSGEDDLTIPATTVVDSIKVYVNGLIIEETYYTIVSNNIVINTVSLGYTLDIDDVIVVTFLDFS